jgi:hypothetical protein
MTEEDAHDLMCEHLKATFRGNRGKHELPHVTFVGATYRAARPAMCWDLVGKTFAAKVPLDDARTMTVYDAKGNVLVVLHARPPYASTAHTLDERRRAVHWRNRGLFQVDEDGDAMGAYHRYVRQLAGHVQWATDQFVKGRAGNAAEHDFAQQHTRRSSPAPAPDTFSGLAPLGGHVGLITPEKNR